MNLENDHLDQFVREVLETPRVRLADLPSIEEDESGSEPQRRPSAPPVPKAIPVATPSLQGSIELPASARLVMKMPYKDMHAEFWDAPRNSSGMLECSIVLENMKPRFLDEWQVTDVSVRFLTVSCPVPRSDGPSQREHGPESYEDFTSLIGERRSDPAPTAILLQITIPPRAADNHVCTALIRFPVAILSRAPDRTFMICGSVMCKAKEVRAKDRDWTKEDGRWKRLYRKDEVKPGTTVTLQCESVLITISSLHRGVNMDP